MHHKRIQVNIVKPFRNSKCVADQRDVLLLRHPACRLMVFVEMEMVVGVIAEMAVMTVGVFSVCAFTCENWHVLTCGCGSLHFGHLCLLVSSGERFRILLGSGCPRIGPEGESPGR